MPAGIAERPLSERTVRNYARAFAAWAAAMRTDAALEAEFLRRIGMTPEALRALPLPDNMGVNLRYRRWQAQIGVTGEETTDERLALARANRDPVVD